MFIGFNFFGFQDFFILKIFISQLILYDPQLVNMDRLLQ